MKVAVSVGKAAIEAAPPKSDNETDKAYQVRLSAPGSLIDPVPDILSTHCDEDNNIFKKEFQKWMRKYKHLFVIDHLAPGRTRNEEQCNVDDLVSHLLSYTDTLFECINKRLKHSDTDIGTTSWSEAPAESIFSVFKMVIHGRESLTVGHTVALCRILTNGPRTGTVEAEKLMEDAAKM